MSDTAVAPTNGSADALDVPDFDDNLQLKQWLSQSRTPLRMIETRQGRGGQEFHYVRHQYITHVLNKICGHNWDFEILREDMKEDQVWALGKLTVRIGEHTIVKSQYGSSDVKRKKGGAPLSIGDDLKSAASDSLKKCASLIGLGLDLSMPIRPNTMQRLHIVGRDKCGDNWDERRRKAIRMLTGGKKTSSKDLLEVEARILIGILEGSDAPIVKEARRKMG